MRRVSEHIESLPFWAELTEEEREITGRNAVIQSYQKGEMIFGRGASCLGMIHVLSGTVRVYILSPDGREITLFRAEAGDNCVVSASCVISQLRFEASMAAEADTELLIVNSGTFQSLAERNLHVRCFMYELATERFSQVMWVLQDILFLRFDQRLAGFLLNTYDKTGEREIYMTQEEMARQVNSAREVVARMLRQFSSDGLVEMRRGCILLKDIGGLRILQQSR